MVSVDNCKVEIIFDQHDRLSRLLEFIKDADIVLGCEAWLTHKKIIKALSKKDLCAIAVQTEKFTKIRSKSYKKRYGELQKWKCEALAKGVQPPIKPVGEEAVGAKRRYGRVARMHNKFLIFCRLQGGTLTPYAVSTGSMNLTENSMQSDENLVVIQNSIVAQRYLEEWKVIWNR